MDDILNGLGIWDSLTVSRPTVPSFSFIPPVPVYRPFIPTVPAYRPFTPTIKTDAPFVSIAPTGPGKTVFVPGRVPSSDIVEGGAFPDIVEGDFPSPGAKKPAHEFRPAGKKVFFPPKKQLPPPRPLPPPPPPSPPFPSMMSMFAYPTGYQACPGSGHEQQAESSEKGDFTWVPRWKEVSEGTTMTGQPYRGGYIDKGRLVSLTDWHRNMNLAYYVMQTYSNCPEGPAASRWYSAQRAESSMRGLGEFMSEIASQAVDLVDYSQMSDLGQLDQVIANQITNMLDQYGPALAAKLAEYVKPAAEKAAEIIKPQVVEALEEYAPKAAAISGLTLGLAVLGGGMLFKWLDKRAKKNPRKNWGVYGGWRF